MEEDFAAQVQRFVRSSVAFAQLGVEFAGRSESVGMTFGFCVSSRSVEAVFSRDKSHVKAAILVDASRECAHVSKSFQTCGVALKT